MARQARMRPSWKKVSAKRYRELVILHRGRTNHEHMKFKLWKKNNDRDIRDMQLIYAVINGQGIGWDENLRKCGGGAMSVLNPIETFEDIF